jgi:hypothetical protein
MLRPQTGLPELRGLETLPSDRRDENFSSLKLQIPGWFILNSGACAPPFNMAMDEALLEAMPRLQKPVLRFYGWTEPAASFGYFQKFEDVSRDTLLRPLIRRSTGGGLVPHDADWTYSLAFPTTHEWYSLKAIESYRRVHEWIAAAFARLNVDTELAAICKRSAPGQCFAGYEKFDVLWHGKKIAGAAQRRSKLGLLIQGSVQPPPIPLSRGKWEAGLRAVARDQWQSEAAEFAPDCDLLRRAEALGEEKYARAAYNQKR